MAAACEHEDAPPAKRARMEGEQGGPDTEGGSCGGEYSWSSLEELFCDWGYNEDRVKEMIIEVLLAANPAKAKAVIEWLEILPVGMAAATWVSLAITLMEFEPSELLDVMEKFVRKADKAVRFLAQWECCLQGCKERSQPHVDLGAFTLDTTYQGMKVVVLAVWKAFFSRMPDSPHWRAALDAIRLYLRKLAAGPLSDQDEQDIRANLSSFYESPAGLEEFELRELLTMTIDGDEVESGPSPMRNIAFNLMIVNHDDY